MSKLYQCPYEKAVRCNLKDCCLECETFGEYLNKNTRPVLNIDFVSNNEVAVCPDCNSEDTAITGTDTMMCLNCGVHWTN